MKAAFLPLVLLGLAAAAPVAGPFAAMRLALQSAREGDDAERAQRFDAAIAAAPGNLEVIREAIAATDDPARRARLIDRFAALGGTFTPATTAQLLASVPPADVASIAARLAANRQPVERSHGLMAISAELPLIEGIAYDARRDCYYLSSVVGRLVHSSCSGRLRRLPLAGPVGPVLGIAYDPDSDRLWFAAAPVFGATDRRTGLFAHDFRTSTLVAVALPDGELSLGDVAVGRAGEVFAADSRSGAVYRSTAGGPLVTIVPPGVLRSAQGMALSADGRSLYVADYTLGLARIDLASGAVAAVRPAAGIGTNGIDGLVRDGNDLIAIQNGWRPARVLRLRLSPDGNAIASAEVLERGHPSHDDPTQGVVVDGRLVYVANSQWPKYTENGDLHPGATQLPTHILALPLRR
jgi:sugar lactone lactonase YvrE